VVLSVIGKKLAHYCILEKVGAGGMGEVYRARDEQLNRDVALKVLLPKDLEDETARVRLLREARAAAGLNHPHICTIHEVGEAGGQAYIAMEYVEGSPLSAMVAQGGLPHEQALRYGVQLADALDHAHSRGVIHRDLKSANVIITPDSRVKVLDFGLAKRLDEGDLEATRSQASLTQPGVVVGTLAYMAPEQLRGELADARSDVWALGIILYEMVAGGRPFQGQTGYEVSSAILSRRPAPLPAEVPAALRVVIQRCIEKDPGRRYQRASDVRVALEAIRFGGTTDQLLPRRTARRKRTGSRKRIQSLAVLPLTNLSRDPEQEYFADGMTEALIADLAKIRALRVISRTSVMRYKATEKSLPEIAEELGVDGVVEGSVLRVGQQVRITAQLIHAATDTHLWADSYERDLQDVLVLQSEVARTIAREIQVAVTPDEKKRLASARPVNPQAHEAYLKGRFHWHKLSRESLDTAMEYFQLALEKDPNYAPAYSGIAGVWGARGEIGVLPAQEAFPKAKAAALKAMELDDTLAEVHLGWATLEAIYGWDWAVVEREFQKSLQLNPNNAEAAFFYADFLLYLGRSEEWSSVVERALALDPLNLILQCFYGWHLVYLKRYDEAVLQLRKVLHREPNYAATHLGLWGAFWKKQRYEEALEGARKYHSLSGYSDVTEALARGYAESDYRGAMKLAAETLAIRARQTYVPAIRVARLYAHAEDNDQAFEWLEKAYEAREGPLARLRVVWDWDNLRGDPRFKDLLRRMNLPQ
jgi:serine/threonine-protein kinase